MKRTAEEIARELLAASEAQHNAIDLLLAVCAGLDPNFMPSRSSAWPILIDAKKVRERAKAELGV